MGMDKALFRAYIKEIVKEQIDETVEKAVKKLLPEILTEAIADIKRSSSPVVSESTSTRKPMIDKSKLAEMMGLERIGDTISAHTGNMQLPTTSIPEALRDNPAVKEAADAINKDYSQLMKKLGMSK